MIYIRPPLDTSPKSDYTKYDFGLERVRNQTYFVELQRYIKRPFSKNKDKNEWIASTAGSQQTYNKKEKP